MSFVGNVSPVLKWHLQAYIWDWQNILQWRTENTHEKPDSTCNIYICTPLHRYSAIFKFSPPPTHQILKCSIIFKGRHFISFMNCQTRMYTYYKIVLHHMWMCAFYSVKIAYIHKILQHSNVTSRLFYRPFYLELFVIYTNQVISSKILSLKITPPNFK